MDVLLILELLLIILVDVMKPAFFTQTPPGAIGKEFLLPLDLGILGSVSV
jgi:hypothetical protein